MPLMKVQSDAQQGSCPNSYHWSE